VKITEWQKHIKQNPSGITKQKAVERSDADLDKIQEIPIIRVGEQQTEQLYFGHVREKEN